MKNIRRTITALLCLAMVITCASCGKKKQGTDSDASIGDIPTASADKDNAQNGDEATENADSGNQNDSQNQDDGKDGKSAAQDYSNKDRTPQSDKTEIDNNIRDAKELINDGNIDDAKALIKVLRSRNLTADQEKQVDRLEAQLISISD